MSGPLRIDESVDDVMLLTLNLHPADLSSPIRNDKIDHTIPHIP